MRLGIIVNEKCIWKRHLDEIIRRRSDGGFYEASMPDDYNMYKAWADLLSGTHHWYFREIVKLPKRWWQKTQRYQRTGFIWEPLNRNEFDIITKEEEIKCG